MLRFSISSTEDVLAEDMRVVLIDYIVGKQQDKNLIVRIEDMADTSSSNTKSEESKHLLEKFSIQYDHLFYQSESLHRYQQLAVSLVGQGNAFVCTCSSEEIEKERKLAASKGQPYRYSGKCADNTHETLERIKKEGSPYVIRIKEPKKSISYIDKIMGEITVEPGGMDSFIIIDTDGVPMSDFASSVDDMLNGISLAIQNDDGRHATSRQIHIRNQLGFDQQIEYAHLPAIFYPDDKPITVKSLLEQGFLPDAIINYLLSIGYDGHPELFFLPDAIDWFKLENISKDSVEFDMDKLRDLNRKHLYAMDDKKLSGLYGFADIDIGKLIKVYLDEAETLNELDKMIKPIFAPKPCDGDQGVHMRTIADLICNSDIFGSFDELKDFISTKVDLDEDTILSSLRLLLTGSKNGPKLDKIYPHIKSYLLEVARCPH